MKKLSIIFLLSAFVLGGLIKLRSILIEQQRGEATFLLVGDLTRFFTENERLPCNWGEFINWYGRTAHFARYSQEDLDGHLSLQWCARLDAVDASGNIIFFKYSIEPSQQLYYNVELKHLIDAQVEADRKSGKEHPTGSNKA